MTTSPPTCTSTRASAWHAAGYVHYEISNWARPGHECAHNLTYWRNLPYIGLGAGAHSWYARTSPR